MLKWKAGNCCIQNTQPIEQKKLNRIKMLTPAEARNRHKRLRLRLINGNNYSIIFPFTLN